MGTTINKFSFEKNGKLDKKGAEEHFTEKKEPIIFGSNVMF